MNEKKIRQSIICPKMRCYICGSTVGLELHHCLMGSYRDLADQDKLYVALCQYHHKRLHDHGDHKKELQYIAQEAWINKRTKELSKTIENAQEKAIDEFRERYGRFFYE